jgi:dTMP kinase
MRQTYGKTLPGMRLTDLPGKLIVIEGTDGAGRSTQIDLLKPWLEELGHAVLDTGMTRSRLAGEGIRRAKERNNLGRVTQSLFYATDFIDRLEREVVPALRAGFIVLTDRYIYSLMARAIVRGMDPSWIRSIYSVALKPDAVFYLRIGIEQLLPRVVFSRGFDYWESGMDLFPGQDIYEGFCNYQATLLAEFDRLGEEYKFETVDASADAEAVCAHLKKKILEMIDPVRAPAPQPVSPEEIVHSLADKILAILARPAPETEKTPRESFFHRARKDSHSSRATERLGSRILSPADRAGPRSGRRAFL